MKLEVKRIAKQGTYTIGKLFIDGEYFCDTLEDVCRGLTQNMTEAQIAQIKVKGQTAIPSGTYKVDITFSQKFKKYLPILENVKGFEGIRIHSGNDSDDTEGCLLVGKNKAKGQVLESRDTFNKLMNKIWNDKNITITIG